MGWYFSARIVDMSLAAKVCWFGVLLGCLAVSVFAPAQSGPYDSHSRENQIVALERLWNEAQVGRDANALSGMIGDKFVNTEYDGEVSDRGKFLADIADPLFRPTTLTIQDVKVILYEDTAVATGVYHTKGTYRAKPYEHTGRFTDTWVLNNARWQCVASHTSLLQK